MAGLPWGEVSKWVALLTLTLVGVMEYRGMLRRPVGLLPTPLQRASSTPLGQPGPQFAAARGGYSPRATPSRECFASSCSQSWRKRKAVSCNGGSPGGMSGRTSRPPDLPEDWLSSRSDAMPIVRPPQPQNAYSGRGVGRRT